MYVTPPDEEKGNNTSPCGGSNDCTTTEDMKTSTSLSQEVLRSDGDSNGNNIDSNSNNTTNSTHNHQPPSKKKPRYPRTAYNYFFQHERDCISLYGIDHNQSIVNESYGCGRRSRTEGEGILTNQMSFTELVRTIVIKWKTLDVTRKQYFEQVAHQDYIRYRTELQEWKENNNESSSSSSLS